MFLKKNYILNLTFVLMCLFFVSACGTTGTTPTAKQIIKDQVPSIPYNSAPIRTTP